jgi:hypothetical protein
MTTMLRTSVALACLLGACTDRDPGTDAASSSETGAPTSDPSGDTTGDTTPTTTVDPTTGDPTGGPFPSMEICADYLTCLAAIAPDQFPEAQESFGPDGTCWQGSAEAAAQCVADCEARLAATQQAFPEVPECGGVAPPASTFLLAVSTVIDASKPFQFLATISAEGGGALSLTLQPLTLDQGQVTTPREPFGEPLQYPNIPLINGEFTVELGPLLYAGQTNPITGGDVQAELTLTGKIVAADFACGTVSGEITSPIMSSVDGSSFAAVLITDGLPTDVVINCEGQTVSDP